MESLIEHGIPNDQSTEYTRKKNKTIIAIVLKSIGNTANGYDTHLSLHTETKTCVCVAFSFFFHLFQIGGIVWPFSWYLQQNAIIFSMPDTFNTPSKDGKLSKIENYLVNFWTQMLEEAHRVKKLTKIMKSYQPLDVETAHLLFEHLPQTCLL